MGKRRLKFAQVKELLNMGSTEVARHLGLAPSTVWNWTRVNVPPHREKQVRKLMKDLGKPYRGAKTVQTTTDHTKPLKTKGTSDKLALINLVVDTNISDEAKLEVINALTK